MNEDGTKARGVIAVCIAILLMTALIGSFVLNPSERQQSNLNLIIGALIGALSTIVGFYFGSSSGAKQLVAGQQKILEAAVPAVASALPLGAGPGPSGTPSDPVSVVAAEDLDPEFVTFSDFVLKINPKATRSEIETGWKAMKAGRRVDVPV